MLSSHGLKVPLSMSIHLNKTLPIYSVVNNTIKYSYMGINTNLKVPYILLICCTLYITFYDGMSYFHGTHGCVLIRKA